MIKFLFAILLVTTCKVSMAQTYTANVSQDSVKTLNNRIELLKTNVKILELKVKESEEEAAVEKLRLKLLEANGKAKASVEESNTYSSKTVSGSSIDMKSMDKMSMKVKGDAAEARKALQKFNKQVANVEEVRAEIKTEERKIGYRKPSVVFSYE
ncbi:hypothetical protein QWY86_09730 [Pedobacter aquatilis]|uniref:hypothetical protein n=1 Tax=Pedobacter aquatilis TaxID=351343 RepID=UPI0025B30139|nr:hypothetical protein [Pedobacter aquatilis]MDN3586948.1 hypothetical protein [Pedobacter aquatilis]